MKAALVIVLFTVSAFAQDISVATAESACGPANTRFVVTHGDEHSVVQPDPEKAVVYVIEDQKSKAVRDVTARVGLDGNWVGANRGNSYLFFSVEPGEHHLCTDWVSDLLAAGRLVSLANFTAEAGKVYYFRARTNSSGDGRSMSSGASIDLDQINSDEGKLLVASSALSVSHSKK